MTLSYINKMMILFLALSAVPASFVGVLLLNEANNMADESEANIEDLGVDVINITSIALEDETESYLVIKLNETMNKVRVYLDERKNDCRFLSNITRTNEAFLGYYQNTGEYVKIAYINSSGYENITVENNKITTNNTNLLNATGYFQETRKLPQEEVYIDNSELEHNYSKHVIRYCVNASDGIVLVEFNVSLVVDIIKSVALRGNGSYTVLSTAFAQPEKTPPDLTVMVLSLLPWSDAFSIYDIINLVTDIEEVMPGVTDMMADMASELPAFFAGNITMFEYIPKGTALANGSGEYLASGAIDEHKILITIHVLADSFLEPVNETNTVIEEGISESIDDMQSSRDNMLITSIVIIASSIGLAVVGALVVGRRLTKRLKDLTETAIRINKGEIDVEVPHRGKDEIGQLAEAFKGLQDGMKYLMQEK